MSVYPVLPKTLARLAAVAFVAVGASACSSIPNWADPTGWIGGGDQATSTTDQGDNAAQTPDLASIPDKPSAPSTADERKEVADTLEADHARAQYSADTLRGGTEPSAAPPPDAAPATQEVVSATAQDSTPAQSAAAAEPTTPSESASSPTAPASAQQAADASPAIQATVSQPAPAAPEPDAQAANESRVPSEAAPPAAAATSDNALGFQPSKAPALDPTVARFVPKSVLDRYQRTSGDTSAPPVLSPPQKSDAKQTSSALQPEAEGRPERRANIAGASTGMIAPAAYVPNRSGPQAVVFFPRDKAVLSSAAKSQVLAAARAYQSQGTSSFVRVVGHSSSRTAEMPMARHLEVVFERSQEFATAVAHELVRDGVPADKVLVEAVGDSQPVYYESMPQGEAGNRRTEIFL